MKLFGPAGLFVLGAIVTYLGFVWRGAGRYWPFAAPALFTFALSLGRSPLPIFAGLFAGVTVAFAVAAVLGKTSYATFAVLASSDLLIAAALTMYQLQTTKWDLPPVGGWGSAAHLAAAAGLLRLTAPLLGEGEERISVTSVGWWQGILVAWWVGASPLFVLCAGGSMLLGLSLLRRSSDASGLGFGGAAAAIAAALGLPASVLFAAGAAGSAFVFGERVVAVWTLAALPLSVFAQINAGQLGHLESVAAAAVPVAIAAAVWGLPRAGSFGGRVTAAIAGVTAGAMAIQRGLFIWLVYATLAGGAFSLVSTRSEDVAADAIPPVVVSTPISRERLAPVVAWAAAEVAVLLMVRMFALGFSTGFL
jgi:hypothetical protein